MTVTTEHYYTGNASTTTYAYTFPYYKTSDIKVTWDGALKTEGTHYDVTGTNIVFKTSPTDYTPANNVVIHIFRETDVDTSKATFAAGSSIRATDLNNNETQLLYHAQEEQGQLIKTADIKDGQITSAKILDGTIATADIADNAINAAKIAANAVDTSEIADNAVTSAKIEDNAVTMAKLSSGTLPSDITIPSSSIGNGTIVEANLANNAVTRVKIVNDAIDGTKIADDAIGSEHIADNAVVTASILNNAVTNDKLSDAELTTLAGMPSATASILASSTALAATTAEINAICDGKAVETNITNDDNKYPTSGAVVDYVAAQIAPLGGLEVIADEDNFPSSQPSSGVVISISDAGGVSFNGSGVATNARTAGNGSDNVTISGAPSSLYNETLVAGVGLMVSSTGSNQTYNYHKILGKEDDIKQLSDDINDFNTRYRVASSAPSSNNDAGDLYFNTGTNKLYTYNGTTSTWDEAQSIGNFYISTFSESFDGSRTAFTVSNAPTYASQLIISINGVIQKPNAGTGQPSEGYTLSGNTVTFSSAPTSGSNYFVVVIGATVNIGTPSDNTVTSAILQNGSVITDKIANDAVTADKLANSINTEIAANTAKVTNATHTGEVTGATALTIADDVVDEANLKVSNSPTNGHYLQAQSGNTGGLTWAAVSQYTTPLTTEGDILYRDGSGDQRLAKGTAGQALIMNSGATAPEWGAAGATIANDANNRVITADGSAGLNGEANLTFDGSTLALTGAATVSTTLGVTGVATVTSQTISRGYESPATVAANWSIGANNNAMFPGPMTVASGVTVTVPANRTLTVV
jgi:hypothetical protein